MQANAGLLFAAHSCQSEVCNGGFQQFFGNSTGVLAPEAVEGFREIGQSQIAALIERAMSLIGTPYPRDREERQARLTQISRSSLDALDEMFYSLIESEAGGLKVRQTVTRLPYVQRCEGSYSACGYS